MIDPRIHSVLLAISFSVGVCIGMTGVCVGMLALQRNTLLRVESDIKEIKRHASSTASIP